MRVALVIAVLGLTGCSGRHCLAAHAPRDDDEFVSGVSVETLMAALVEPFDALDLEWSDGTRTTAHVSVVVVPGTAHRSQRPDCLDECHTTYHLSMACGPEQLVVDAGGIVSTDDGRVVDFAWNGSISAEASGGPMEWTARQDHIPPSAIAGTADWAALGAVDEDTVELGVSVLARGMEGQLQSIEFAISADVDHDDDGKVDAVVFSNAASQPTVE